MLANEGVWSPLRFSEDDLLQNSRQKSRRVFSAHTANQISAILSDRSLRASTFGLDSVLAAAYPAAVKTGTSKDMRDNWCLGYSKDFTVGVWVGNSGGDPMWQVSGIVGAAPVWRSVMDHLHKNRAKKDFGMVAEEKIPAFHRESFAKIRYPQDGMIVALDPDIPDEAERVPLEADGEGIFHVNGKLVESDLWQPTKGKHLITLYSKNGELRDQVQISVR